MTFSKFEASLDAKTTMALTSCVLSMQIHAREGVSVRLAKVNTKGYAFLEQGVTATIDTTVWQMGSAMELFPARTQLKGPFDDTYRWNDRVQGDATWSACKPDAMVNIRYSLRLKREEGHGTGYLNLNLENDPPVELETRPCKPAGVAQIAPDAGPIAPPSDENQSH